MAATTARSENRSYADINMTPLIDVMLVLLIIFIVTVPMQTHAIKVDNPASQPRTPSPPPEVIDLMIDFDGSLLWNRQLITQDKLQRYAAIEAAKSPQPEVHITADRFARYEAVAQILALLQRQGLDKIGFVNRDFLER